MVLMVKKELRQREMGIHSGKEAQIILKEIEGVLIINVYCTHLRKGKKS